MKRWTQRILAFAITLATGAGLFALMRAVGSSLSPPAPRRTPQSPRSEPDRQPKPSKPSPPPEAADPVAEPLPFPGSAAKGGSSDGDTGRTASSKTAPPAAPTTPEEAVADAPQRCQATTTSGRRCRRDAEPGSSYCWQHDG